MKPEYQPRIRMFAGPNGSGKSFAKSILSPELLGIYINPDEIEKEIKEAGFLDLKKFDIITTRDEIIYYLSHSKLLVTKGVVDDIEKLLFEEQKLKFLDVKIDSYFASAIADFIRQKLIKDLKSFSFETVMSSPDKIELLKKANSVGYKTYLYFIATESPSINISRIKYRVKCGGHDVPDGKVISRYYRSLDLLMNAIENSWRAYIFDNSENKEDNHGLWLAEARGGKIIEIKANQVPEWFYKYVIDKLIP